MIKDSNKDKGVIILSDTEKLLSHILDYDAKTDIAVIKFDFLTPDKQAVIEDIFINKKEFALWFKKPFRRLKTYLQLKKYFALLKQILIKAEIYPDSEVTKTLDVEIKKSILPCKKIEIDGHIIPVVPSKADLDIDAMKYLIQEVINRYGVE
jgi:hypothetical protein